MVGRASWQLAAAVRPMPVSPIVERLLAERGENVGHSFDGRRKGKRPDLASRGQRRSTYVQKNPIARG